MVLVSPPLHALKKMTAAYVDIRQKFKYAAYGKENECFIATSMMGRWLGRVAL